jgi:hypothetical protein
LYTLAFFVDNRDEYLALVVLGFDLALSQIDHCSEGRNQLLSPQYFLHYLGYLLHVCLLYDVARNLRRLLDCGFGLLHQAKLLPLFLEDLIVADVLGLQLRVVDNRLLLRLGLKLQLNKALLHLLVGLH